MMQGYSTISFIGLYLLARYVNIYKPVWSQWSIRCDLAIYACTVIIATIATFVPPYYFNIKIPLNFYSYICPTTIVGALYLFLAFSKIKLSSKFVNWCGISCFSVFLMHVSPSTLWHYRDLFIKLHEELPTLGYWVVTFAVLIIIFFVSILIDKIRLKFWNICWDKIFCRMEQTITSLIK